MRTIAHISDLHCGKNDELVAKGLVSDTEARCSSLVDEEIFVVGLNAARPFTKSLLGFWKAGSSKPHPLRQTSAAKVAPARSGSRPLLSFLHLPFWRLDLPRML